MLPEYGGLTGVSDASWGSSDLERRRSTSGSVIFWQGSLVKAYSRLQGCVTLSSCEAEIIAVCQLTQECLGIRHITEFLERFGNKNMLLKMSTKEFLDLSFDDLGHIGGHYPILVFSDSQSCLGALNNQGLSHRVRHMSIAVCYIQSLKDIGNLVLEWMPGAKCTADLLTKVLSKEINDYRRSQLGIVEVLGREEWQVITTEELKKQSKRSDAQTSDVQDEDPCVEDLSALSATKGLSGGGLEDFESFLQLVGSDVKAGKVTHIIIELCTNMHAGLSQGTSALKSSHCVVVPVTKEVYLRCVHKPLLSWIVEIKKVRHEALFLGWTSPPCTGGSPVLNLIPEPRRGEIQEGHLKTLRACFSKAIQS